MQVTQVVSGRFHHFHLARQLDRRGLLRGIWTGYPRAKLKDEQGIDRARIHSVPAWHIAYVLALRTPGLRSLTAPVNWLFRAQHDAVDRAAARAIDDPTILVALSGSGLAAGRAAQRRGGRYVCDRGSSHIAYQRDLLVEEYRRWNCPPPRFDDHVVAKELEEYAAADRITVPSAFVRDSFVERGMPADRMRLLPYGGRLDRFSPQGEPDSDWFTLLFVGGVSVRKGLPYLLQGFARFRHPRKRLRIIGTPEPHIEPLLATLPREQVEFLGQVPNTQLAGHYSRADVMVLPSIEEGLAMVMGEALACGCPVIATRNTGAAELFDDGVEGRILPIRDVDALVDALTAMADQPEARQAMRRAARARIGRIGGWDSYGDRWAELVAELAG